MKHFHVYMMTNRPRGTLYTSVTSYLQQRVHQYKNKLVPGFTHRYNLTMVVYAERADDALAAISREKQIKGWLRAKEIELIESMYPDWRDLSKEWFADAGDPSLRSG